MDEVIEVHRNPQPSTDAPPGWRYGAVERYGSRDRVAPLAQPDRFIAVEDLLP